MNVNGEYVEVRRVLSENLMPHTHRSYDKVPGIRLPSLYFLKHLFIIKISFFQEPHLSYKNVKLNITQKQGEILKQISI